MPPCPRACRNARVDYEKYAEDCEQKVSDQSARICIIKRLVGARVWGGGHFRYLALGRCITLTLREEHALLPLLLILEKKNFRLFRGQETS